MKCPICSGKRPFCIHKSYPLPKDFNIEKKIKESLSKDFFGPSYSVFVGHYGYPNINIGPLAGLQQNPDPDIDDPSQWFGKSYDEIIMMRSMLIRSRQKENIFSKSRYILDNQELALAKKATDTEITFKKDPVYHFSLSDSIQPMGPVGTVDKFRITENVKISRQVDKIVSDDLKAHEAAVQLYKNHDVYKITTILSSGALGLDNKKIVPTRWSITATDDIVTKDMLEKIRTFPSINNYLVFEGNYLGNYFAIFFMPGNWEYENFEVWAPGSNWSKHTSSRIIPEYEPHKGRTSYAEGQAGGYYAARIAAVEVLTKMKKQARVVSFREVSDEYSLPMGVWVVRETARKAMENVKKFSTRQEAISYIKTKLKVPYEQYVKKSKILVQKRLWDY